MAPSFMLDRVTQAKFSVINRPKTSRTIAASSTTSTTTPADLDSIVSALKNLRLGRRVSYKRNTPQQQRSGRGLIIDKRRNLEKRIERAARSGALQEFQARKKTPNSSFRGAIRPREKNAKREHRLKNHLFISLVRLGVIKPPSAVLTPFSLKKLLPRVGMIYQEQMFWDEKGGEYGDGAFVIRKSSQDSAFLGRFKKDASLEWAIWADRKCAIEDDFEPIVARAVQVGIRLIREGFLQDTFELESDPAENAWGQLMARVRADSTLDHKWPSRVTAGRFEEFFGALLNASWRDKHYAGGNNHHREPELLVRMLRAFLDEAEERNSPWYLGGVDDEDQEEDEEDESPASGRLWSHKHERCTEYDDESAPWAEGADQDEPDEQDVQDDETDGEEDHAEEKESAKEVVVDNEGDVVMDA